MRTTIFSVILLLCTLQLVKADGHSEWLSSNTQLQQSNAHIWLGDHSYCWETENSPLVLSATSSKAVKLKGRHFMLKVYNPGKSEEGKLLVEIMGADKKASCSFEFLMAFKGWQPMICEYAIMKGSKPSECTSVRITPIGLPNNHKLYLSNLDLNLAGGEWLSGASFSMPESPYMNEKYLQSYAALQQVAPVSNVTAQEVDDIALIKKRILKSILSEELPNAENAMKQFNKINIHFDENGHLHGNPLGNKKGAGGYVHGWFYKALQELAVCYKQTKDPKYKKAIELGLLYSLDRGITAGAHRHVGLAGYGFGGSLPATLALMDGELDPKLARDMWDSMAWHLNIGYPLLKNPDPNTDWYGTKGHLGLYYALFVESDPAKQIALLRAWYNYHDDYLSYRFAAEDHLKPDGSVFHHGAHYLGYACTSHWKMISNFHLLRGTSFQMKHEWYEKFRSILELNADNVVNATLVPWTMNCRKGRPQDYKRISQEDWKMLAEIGGGVYGKEFDPKVAAIANRIYPEAMLFDIPAENSPAGFWQQNYATAGFYRRSDWLAYMRGFTDKLWGTEIAAGINRYSYFQGHGGLEILYPGTPKENGYNPSGWDYNLFPGTTSLRMTPEELKAATKGKGWASYFQNNPFCGSIAFGSEDNNYFDTKGNYGLFGFDFESKFIKGFSFKKTSFCLNDNYIVCLVSDLNSSDKKNPAITTLFQRNGLKNMQVILDGKPVTKGKMRDALKGNHWMLDPLGTGYWVKDATLKVSNLKEQTYPLHDDKGTGKNPAAWAYIDQGLAPKNATTEFVAVPAVSENEMSAWAENFQNGSAYTVLMQNTDCHAIKDLETGLTGMAIYEPNGNLPEGHITKVDQSCLIVHRINGHNFELAVSNPKLGVTGWEHKNDSQTIIITLAGKWESVGISPEVEVSVGDDQTHISVKAQYGKRYQIMVQSISLLNQSLHWLIMLIGIVFCGCATFIFRTLWQERKLECTVHK